MTENLLVRALGVCKMTSLSRSTIWRLVKNNKFPKPFSISQRATAWKVEDIKDWVENKKSE